MQRNQILQKILKNVFIVSLMLALFSSCKTKEIYTSSWNEKTVNNNEYMHYSTNAKMLYGILNDNEKLYVILEVSDKTVQKKILMAGLTFWMDTLGKKKKQLGLTFPQKGSMKNRFATMDKQEMMQQMQNGGMQGSIDYQQINKKFSNGFSDMEIVGFNNEKKTITVFNKNPKGINASINFDKSGILHYKASIPLKSIFNQPKQFLNDTTRLFSFGFETGAVEMPTMSGGGKPRGGGMQGGGMAGKGKSGGGMQGMQEVSKPSKFWVKSARLIKL